MKEASEALRLLAGEETLEDKPRHNPHNLVLDLGLGMQSLNRAVPRESDNMDEGLTACRLHLELDEVILSCMKSRAESQYND